MAIDPSGEIKLVRGDLKKDDNPYLLRDIKDRPVGPTMRAHLEKASQPVSRQWDAETKQRAPERTCTFPEREGCSWACGPTSTSSTSTSSGSRKTASGNSKTNSETTDRAFRFSVRHGLQRYPGNRAGRHEHHPLRHQSQNRQHSYRRYPQCFENTGKFR